MSGVRDGEGKTRWTVQILPIACSTCPTSLTEFSSRPREVHSALMSFEVSQALVDDFRRDGAVCVRGAFSAAEVGLVAEGIERNLADPSRAAIVASRDDDAGRFFEDFCNWDRIAEFERFIRTRRRPAIAGALMGSSRCGSTTTTCSSRSPGRASPRRGTRTSPTTTSTAPRLQHVDAGRSRATRESTLEFVAGSHRGPWLMPRTFMDDQARWFPEGTSRSCPTSSRPRPRRSLGWELEPGDAVFFHMLTLHAAGGRTTRRRAFSCGSSATTSCTRRGPGHLAGVPRTRGRAGRRGAMEHRLFPVVWEASRALA